MRVEKWFVNEAKSATFIVIWLIVVAMFLTLGILFLPNVAIVILAPVLMISSPLAVSYDSSRIEQIHFWKSGRKRKFRVYSDVDGKAYVETKVGFFWIPIRDDHRNIKSWNDAADAMEMIQRERGFSSATLQGEFEA